MGQNCSVTADFIIKGYTLTILDFNLRLLIVQKIYVLGIMFVNSSSKCQ